MKSLGEYLRAERLARGISLEQISADTRITINMLRAIEEGDLGQLPATVFTKGFLRAYAEQVGIDADAVIAEYQDLIKDLEVRQDTMESFHRRLRPEPAKKRLLGLMLALALLVAVTLVLWQTKHVRQESPPARSEAERAVNEKSPMISKNDSVSGLGQAPSETLPQQDPDLSTTGTEPSFAEPELDTQTPQVSPADVVASHTRGSTVHPDDEYPQQEGIPSDTSADEYPRQEEVQSAASASYVLRIEAKETTWLSVTIDEMQQREYTLQPGEQVTWSAESGYRLHIGNAAGLQLYLNDKPIKSLGRSGRVVRLELPDPSLFDGADPNTPSQ